MTTQTVTTLFFGQPLPCGGLSNEDELAKACPDKFKGHNPWSDYVRQVFLEGGSIANWKWKSGNQIERDRQMDCFQGVLETLDLQHEDKEAVAGWMLSEMLTEVPEYVPGEKN